MGNEDGMTSSFMEIKTSVERDLSIEEKVNLERIVKILENEKKLKALSLVKNGETFKVVSATLPKGWIERQWVSRANFFIENYLYDYITYLDYLYINGIEEASELMISLEEFELFIKAIVSYYDVDIKVNQTKLIKVTNNASGNMIFFSADDMRSTFNISLLHKIRADVNEKFSDARNKPGIKEIAKLLKNNPRPTLRMGVDD